MLYFCCVLAGAELSVEGSLEEVPQEGVRVGGEEGRLGVGEFGHYCQ